MPDSTHTGTPQSLYGKLQLLRSLSDPSGGTSHSGLMVQHKTDWGFLLDSLYSGSTLSNLQVTASMRSWLVDWIQDKYEYASDTRAIGQAMQGFLSQLAMVPTSRSSLLVLYNKKVSIDFWSPVIDSWYAGQSDPIQVGIAVPMFISGLQAVGWTVADYPFLQVSSYAKAGLAVELVVKDILASDAFEYDLEDGGIGGTIIIIDAGGAGGIKSQEVLVQRNAYFQVKLTAAEPITGYDVLPARVIYNINTQVLSGYITDAVPVTINFNLADSQVFSLTFDTYRVERSAV